MINSANVNAILELASFSWNGKPLDLEVHSDVFVSSDGNPFDDDCDRTNWRVCAWEESLCDEPAGAVVLHHCHGAEDARALQRVCALATSSR
ncbi:hypothetical protein [Vibrio furnissii]|uniref:hypothetical protein n=1 Tax=Vibrio furnissii TaxID=29494 RepID=UPI001C9CE99D|nr:hypothetical protein [Vibrio furnissii]MBY7933101.1 hypothetical protein [Vibrio fluvialis]MCG6230241.1 hypothetical protein [Vibrio furnissii]MCG6268439.1 hypothetical protein [Vibrio furnissii]